MAKKTKKPKLTPMDEIDRRFKEAIDPDHLDRLYAYKLAMNGHGDEALNVLKNGTGYWSQADEVPEYPPIIPPAEAQGLQNHALVSSRINVQAIVYADPVFEFVTRWPIVRKVNEAWVRYKWERLNWANKNYQVGMEVEGCATGYVEHGIDDDNGSNFEFRSSHDVFPDPNYADPNDGRYFFRRARLSIDQALEKYEGIRTPTGSVTKQDIEAMVVDLEASGTRNLLDSATRGLDVYRAIVYEWMYVDKTTLVLVIGSMTGTRLVFHFDPATYELKHGGPGETPYSEMPFSVWVDSFTPGAAHPTSKMETTWRISAELNKLEMATRATIRRSVPLNLISTFGLDPDSMKSLKAVQAGEEDFLDNVADVVLMNVADVSKAMARVSGGEVSQSTMFLHGLLKNELNAASGVMDSQRGQALPGEKTAFEVRELFASQGVQSRHTQRQYASFVKDVVRKQRLLAARFESNPSGVYLEDEGYFSFELFNRETFLSQDLQMIVTEEALRYKPRDQKILERMEIFTVYDMVMVEAGIFDPLKIAKDVNRVLGRTNPAEFFTDELLQAVGGAPVGGADSQPGVQGSSDTQALIAAVAEAVQASGGTGGAPQGGGGQPAAPAPSGGQGAPAEGGPDFMAAIAALGSEDVTEVA